MTDDLLTKLTNLTNLANKAGRTAATARKLGTVLCALMLVGLFAAPPAAANQAATSIMNDLRIKKGLNPVAYSARLEKAARAHAEDMARRNFFGHKGSDGSNVGHRTRRHGYSWCNVAENIAMGQTSLRQVMQDWVDSRGHYKNIMNRKMSQFAVYAGPRNTWVMVLARPGC